MANNGYYYSYPPLLACQSITSGYTGRRHVREERRSMTLEGNELDFAPLNITEWAFSFSVEHVASEEEEKKDGSVRRVFAGKVLPHNAISMTLV